MTDLEAHRNKRNSILFNLNFKKQEQQKKWLNNQVLKTLLGRYFSHNIDFSSKKRTKNFDSNN